MINPVNKLPEMRFLGSLHKPLLQISVSKSYNMDAYRYGYSMDPLYIQIQGCMQTFFDTGILKSNTSFLEGSNMEMLAELLTVVVSNHVEHQQAFLLVMKYIRQCTNTVLY